MTKKPNNDFIHAVRRIGTAQSVKGQLLKYGSGFQPADPAETPYAVLGGRNIYHVRVNTPAFPISPLRRRRGLYAGGLFNSSIIMGSPSVGGDLDCYLQKARNKIWVLWVDTRIDAWFFGGPVRQPFAPEPIAWCRAEKDDTRPGMAMLLMHAFILGLGYCEKGELYTNIPMQYSDQEMYGFDEETHFLIASVFRSLHRSQKELDSYAALCPPSLREHFLHQAVIDPDADPRILRSE